MPLGVLALLVAAGLVACPVHATPVDHSLSEGRQLAESCRSSGATARAMCLGYLAAIADDVRHQQATDQGQASPCLPPGTTLELYREAWLTYAAANPEILSRRSFPAVKAALAARWPCR